jgi:CBS domain-containing protein
MNVAQLLDFKGHEVATISQERAVGDAVAMMRERGVGALVVTGHGTPLAGIISERDIVRALAARGAEILTDDVGTLMSRDVVTCSLDTHCSTLMGLMTTERIRHLPVLDAQRLVGIISIGDVVRARFEELERDRQELLEYVQAR